MSVINFLSGDPSLAASWQGGVAPTANDVANFNAASGACSLTAAVNWGGIAASGYAAAFTSNGYAINTGASGWAVPTATDIAFSYFVARLIFGKGHPAVAFLLLLAIVDDALGLLILAIFYPQGDVQPAWLLLSVAAIGVCVLLYFARRRHFLWYLLLAGPLSWAGFAFAGLHPALGLLPIVPMLPHAHLRSWHAKWDFLTPGDATRFERRMKTPVEIILCLFGLLNAGVLLTIPSSQEATVMLLVFGGLVVGKPLGIFLTALLAIWLGLGLSAGLRRRDLLVVGVVAGIGFTVAIFVATVAFPGQSPDSKALQSAAKLGALASFASALLAWPIARWVGVRRQQDVR